MIIYLRALGLLEAHLGSARLVLELDSPAALGDLWDVVARELGDRLPAAYWDDGARRFRRSVFVLTGGMEARDDSVALSEGQEVLLLLPVTGG